MIETPPIPRIARAPGQSWGIQQPLLFGTDQSRGRLCEDFSISASARIMRTASVPRSLAAALLHVPAEQKYRGSQSE